MIDLVAAKKKRVDLGCVRCGKVFERFFSQKGEKNFCSVECANVFHGQIRAKAREERVCAKCGKDFEFKLNPTNGSKGIFCSSKCYHAFKERKKYYCLFCGDELLSRGRYCSDYCKFCSGVEKRASKPPKLPKPKLPRKITTKSERRCVDCDCVVIGTAAKKRCKKCHRKHWRKWAKKNPSYLRHREQYRKRRAPIFGAKRKARLRGAMMCENFHPFEVFERDGWCCQICGCDTPKDLRGSNLPNSPELDHIVSLAKGGTHTWENVQLACRACNNAKSDKDFTIIQRAQPLLPLGEGF